MLAQAIEKRPYAITGGEPLFESPLHVGMPNIGSKKEILRKIEGVLDRRMLSNGGPMLQEFEQKVADIANVRHCIAMANGTIALEIAIRALGMKGEVIMPSMTFVATAHALQWQRITPVFCDIDENLHHIDSSKIEALITPRTTGILAVNLWGRPCYVERLEAIAKAHNLKLLFDSAHAFGASYKGRMVGQFGDAEVFSFHATKFLNTFEGGAVLTNDDELAEKIRLMKNFGFNGRDSVGYIGINGKMNEVQAAMGLVSLDSMECFIDHNRRNYLAYREGMMSVPGLSLLEYQLEEKNNYQYIIVEVDEAVFGLTRDELVAVLSAENVDVRRYFYPGCHRMEPYQSYFPNAFYLLPVTEKILGRVIAFPTGGVVTREAINLIISLLHSIQNDSHYLKQQLSVQEVVSEHREQCMA
ncbi:MAG TPA: aminotransferase class I/II-fold pyridoxal phosphate-dependent enzyme [Gammaproteobacteria bacterium]|nr:aminotransferase class I/II-fold pyridoxal phosphate-dependent enzyme [Gammaproteobacteria bacterium]